MKKKVYNGLDVVFVPVEESDVITTSTSACEITSVQYYVNIEMAVCNTEEGDAPKPDDETGYSYNWDSEPHFD